MTKVFNRAVKIGGEKRVISSTTVQALLYDADGNILLATGTTVPTGAGYAKSCLFIDTDVATGSKALYENIGTTAAASFNLLGDVAASEIALAEGSVLLGNSSGVAAALDASGDAKVLVGNGTTVVSVAVSGAIAITNAGVTTIADDAVSVEHLDDGILPSHVVKFAGEFTTAGGDAAEQASVAGVVATDIVVASILDDGTNNVTLLASAAGTDVIDFTMSADPSTDCVISYVVLRAAA